MNENKAEEPQPSSIPIMEAMEKANIWRKKGADVYFKFTCCHCGERCTFEEKNTLYEEGECDACKGITDLRIHGVGFALMFMNPSLEQLKEIANRGRSCTNDN